LGRLSWLSGSLGRSALCWLRLLCCRLGSGFGLELNWSYLCNHHNQEVSLLYRVVCKSLGVVVHDLSVSDEFLEGRLEAVLLLDLLLELFNLELGVLTVIASSTSKGNCFPCKVFIEIFI